MTRFVAAVAAVAVVAVGVTGAAVLTDDDGSGGAAESVAGVPLSNGKPWAPYPLAGGNDFQEPEQIERPNPKSLAPQVINVPLRASSGLTTIAGSDVYARTYNGEFVGPTIHARPGDTINVAFTNDLGTKDDNKPVYTNIHYHGLHVSPEDKSDNIFRTFKPRPDNPDDPKHKNPYESKVVLEPNQPVGTYWYHAHFHGISDGQVMGGLSGLIMFDGLKSLLPTPFQKIDERQITLRDVQLATDNNGKVITTPDGYNVLGDNSSIEPAPRSTYRMVNGQYKPKITMPAGKYELWHLANIGSDVFYDVALAKKGDPADRQKLYVVAEDGLPVWTVDNPEHLLIPPGKRFDVLVLGRAADDYELVTLPYPQTSKPNFTQPRPIPCEPANAANWPDCHGVVQTLATVKTTGSGPDNPPTAPESVVTKDDPEVPTAKDLSTVTIADKDKATFAFDYPTGGKFEPVIYEEPLNPDTDENKREQVFKITQDPIIAPVLGATQEWTLINKTPDDHPFHIHVNGFQVTQRTDANGDLQPYPARGHQDVVNIPKAMMVNGVKKVGKVVIRQHYADFDGWYVFHCHILNHEDAGMMRTVQILKDKDTPVTPPPEASDPQHGH